MLIVEKRPRQGIERLKSQTNAKRLLGCWTIGCSKKRTNG
ncbi:hypothetical protein YSA_05408 [Pseudomonas putida ND6]|uniref:Uncharacterized protein n=1 Tax=Pseudomonas putida ND6 TaxID=231023 RepID=I3UW21_PSEPU|nr:hypothetical protein YSA_05408 [Pseudomonas putida ND6]